MQISQLQLAEEGKTLRDNQITQHKQTIIKLTQEKRDAIQQANAKCEEYKKTIQEKENAIKEKDKIIARNQEQYDAQFSALLKDPYLSTPFSQQFDSVCRDLLPKLLGQGYTMPEYELLRDFWIGRVHGAINSSNVKCQSPVKVRDQNQDPNSYKFSF